VLRRHAVAVMLSRGAPTLQVATMLAGSATHGDLQAVTTLRDAAAELASTSAVAAAGFSVRALELLPDESTLRAQVGVESIMLLWQSGRASAAQQLASTMLAGTLGTDPAAETRIRLGLARFTTRYSSAEAARQCETALGMPGLPDSLRVELQLVLAINLGLSGEPDAAEAVLAPVVQRLQRVPDPVLTSTLARAQSYAAFHRRAWDLAFRRHHDVERLAPATDETSPTAMWEAAMWTSIGQPVRSLSLIDPELTSARRDGRVGTAQMWSSMRARALYDAGRLEEARAEAEAVLELEDIDAIGGLRDLLVVYALVRLGLDTGRPDLVRTHRARVRQMTTDATKQVRRNGLWLEALIADRAGDLSAAMGALADAVMMFDRPGPSLAGLPDVHDEVAVVRMALRAGDRRIAGRAVDAAEDRSSVNSTYPTALASARHARALLTDDEACLREALQLMANTERPLVRASALEDLGRMVAPQHPREAVAVLDEASELYTRSGAEHHAARVRTRLRDLGVRRRRAPAPPRSRHGLAALTPGERAVVHLVAEGGTNRQVAQQLFLSPHTVNTHLRNAFSKLQVRSRVELTRLVANEEAP
jgi:DNA-binding CsgD family transcriptional regulator